MAPGDLRSLLARTPFQLFISSGHSYPIAGPEWMMVTSTTTVVGIPGQAGDGDRVLLIDNYQITHIEPIATTVSPAA